MIEQITFSTWESNEGLGKCLPKLEVVTDTDSWMIYFDANGSVVSGYAWKSEDFEFLGDDAQEAEARFGHLFSALRAGIGYARLVATLRECEHPKINHQNRRAS